MEEACRRDGGGVAHMKEDLLLVGVCGGKRCRSLCERQLITRLFWGGLPLWQRQGQLHKLVQRW